MMQTLAIDIETFSDRSIKEAGAFAYADSPQFSILLFAYAFGDDPVRVVDLARGERLPDDVRRALTDPKILKTAFNANFEMTCLGKFLPIDCAQWECTAVLAAMLGLPGTLEGAGLALGLPEDKQKLATGKALIRYFCTPGRSGRNLPEKDPEKWKLFKEYCARDVEAEREIRTRVKAYRHIGYERKLWQLDQEITKRGVLVDRELASNAVAFDRLNREELEAEAVRLTGLKNPNSVAQLKAWLEEEDLSVTSLNKEGLSALMESTDSETVKRVLTLRKMMSKTSIKKYTAMLRAIASDGRAHGLLQFYGANRTGRWAGRLIQVQNLPRNRIKSLETARTLVKSGDYALFRMIYDDPAEILSQLIRTAFIPASGSMLVADFSAIEARVIAWLAGEGWRLKVFRSHGKIYEASASQMFHVPLEEVSKDLRQKGKVAELALGYGGGKGALINMGALNMGLSEGELPGIVQAWRRANPAICKLWREMENAAIAALKTSGKQAVRGTVFEVEQEALFVRLPSGRCLAYFRPELSVDGCGREVVTYMGVNQNTRKWERTATYGGKWVENIVQAIARDCLAEFMLRLAERGYRIVFHVHDEVILEGAGKEDLGPVLDLMREPVPWAPDLPLKGEGFLTDYYKKD